MKKLTIFITAIIMLFSIACAEKKGDGIISLKGYRYGDPSDAQFKVDERIIEAFEIQNPNIKIEWEYVMGEPYHQKLQSMVAANTVPDIFTMWLGARGAYVTDRGAAMDLSPFMTAETKSNFDPNVWEAQGPNGEIYIISPTATTSHLMFGNKKLMDELGLTFPKTHEELIEQGKIIRDAGLIPIALSGKDDWVINSVFLSALVGRYGGKEWFDKARTGEASFSDPNFVMALNIIQELIDNQMFAPGVTQLSYTQGFELYIQEKAVYLIDASWKLNAMIQDAPEVSKITEVGIYPAVPGETYPNSTSTVYGDHLAINSKLSEEKAAAAFKFIMFHVGKEGSDMKMKDGLLTTYNLDPNDYEMHPLTQKYINLVNSTSKSYVIDAIMNPEGMGVLNPAVQAMMLGEKTSQEAADDYEDWVAKKDSNRKK